MRRLNVIVAAACLAVPAQLAAQDVPLRPAIGAVGAVQADNDGDHGDNPRLGLLGLLGLAGLLGLFRREPDIHVDARGDKRG